MNSSRTNLRLQLMREQSMLDEQHNRTTADGLCLSPMADDESSNGLRIAASMINRSYSPVSITTSSSSHAAGLDLNEMVGGCGSAGACGTNGSSMKSSPIIISQPIRFTGNRLVHLPPQIIHVSHDFCIFLLVF